MRADYYDLCAQSRERKRKTFKTAGVMQRFVLGNRQIIIRAAAEKSGLLNQSALPAKKVSVYQIFFFLNANIKSK